MTETKRNDYERYYDPPLATVGDPGVFRARVWYRVALVLFFGMTASPLMVMGLLNLVGLVTPPGMGPAEARPAGVGFTAFGLVLGTTAFLLWVQVVARRGPAARAYREGLEVRLFGPSTVYGVPSAPGPVRLALAFLSGQPCRLPMVRVPWATLAGVSVTDEELERELVVQWRPEPAGEDSRITLLQSEIAAPVATVAGALLAWAADENGRESLPGWGDPA